MIRVNIVCKGPTEERFVSKMLAEYFISRSIILNPINLNGGFNYNRLKNNIIKTLNHDKSAYATTLVDLYGINNDYPGYALNQNKEALQKVEAIEQAVEADILAFTNLHNRQFFAYFQLHEFETLLFSEPQSLEESLKIDHPNIPRGCFAKILASFPTAEHINDSVHTKPSKRILDLAPSYNKVADGIIIAEIIGVEQMRAVCPHFNSWLQKIENLT